MVSVIYSFHYDSTSIKQQLTAQASASYNGVFDSGSFSAFVSSFFGSTNTSRTMSYEFYSSDPLQSPTNFNSQAPAASSKTCSNSRILSPVWSPISKE